MIHTFDYELIPVFYVKVHAPENYIILYIPVINMPVIQRILKPIPPSLYGSILNDVCVGEVPFYF